MTKPNINVTPLIDVLLVLLIIFMVITPLKPSAFKTKIPQEPTSEAASPNPLTLVVSIDSESNLTINHERDMGTAENPEKTIARLENVFAQRLQNHTYAQNLPQAADLTEEDKIEKTVFIKAPRGLVYGKVARVIDAVKQSGARPISLQIDDLQ